MYDRAVSERSIVIPLPRGGTYVRTGMGAVQFGLPPETIKDSMDLGLEIPQVFVLPRVLFDRRRGLSVAETEFPSYYNFFLLKRRARLVVEGNVEAHVPALRPETSHKRCVLVVPLLLDRDRTAHALLKRARGKA